MNTWRLAASDTHLYPGARLRCLDEEGDERLASGDRAIIEFSDAGMAHARVLATAPGTATLAVDAHRTARGAAVPGKTWLLVPGDTRGWLRIRRHA